MNDKVMKLKRFNPGNTRTIRKGRPIIRFAKKGQISLSATLVHKIGLSEKDSIEFIQDEERPKDWYLIKAKSGNGFSLRKYKSTFDSLLTNSSGMVDKFLESIDKKGVASVGCLVSTKPTEVEGLKLYAIITSSAS